MNMKYILLTLLVMSSACVSTLQDGSLVTSVTSAPRVFEGADMKFFVDVENTGARNYGNVVVDFFDTGFLEGDCSKSIGNMEPAQTASFVCTLKAKETGQDSIENVINVRTRYSSSFKFLKNIEVISQNEYEMRRLTGNLETLPSSESFSDNSLQADVSLSSDLPLIGGREDYFFFMQLSNIGGGIPSAIEKGGISVESRSLLQQGCASSKLELVDSRYPQITCKLQKDKIDAVKNTETFPVLVEVKYSYDVRDKVYVEIAR